MKTSVLIVLSLFFTSCMHLGMMGAHGGRPSGEHQGRWYWGKKRS